MKPAFLLSRQDFEQKSNCWKSTSFFHHFRFLSGGKFELSKFISARFSKPPFFCPVNIQMKNLFAEMFTLLVNFFTLCRKNWTAAEIISEVASKLPFPCSEQLFAKYSFPWKSYNFSINFCFEQIKLRFLQNHCSRVVKIALFDVHETLRWRISSMEKFTITFNFFRILSQKNLDFSKNVSAGLSKLPFSCPLNTFT